jgi:hypothetical protein
LDVESRYEMPKKEIAIEILEEAIGRVERGWTKLVSARDHYGNPVSPLDDEATRFCIDGAIARVAWERGDGVHNVVAVKAIEENESCRISTLNDELVHSVEEAVTVMRRGISSIESGKKKRGRGKRGKKKRTF